MGMSPGYGLKLLTPPSFEPVTAADMGDHSRVIGNDDLTNGVMDGFILAARDHVETMTKRKIAEQQWLLTVDAFPGRQVDDYRPPTWRYGIFRMPFAPLVSVDSVKFVAPDVLGAQPFPLTTLDPSLYMVDTNTEPGRLAPAPYQVWPVTNPLAMQAVQVTFTCGYPDLDTLKIRKPGLILATKLLAAHFYEHREETTELALKRIPLGLKALISANSAHEYD